MNRALSGAILEYYVISEIAKITIYPWLETIV